MTLRVRVLIAAVLTVAPAFAQGDLAQAPMQLTLQATTGSLGERCRRIETTDSMVAASLHRTFHDDFDTHPLAGDRWVPHYAGGAAWPEAQYWGGDGSDFKRKTAWNGEQQIYVDPRYGGRSTTPLGLNPFSVRDGILSIVASRTASGRWSSVRSFIACSCATSGSSSGGGCASWASAAGIVPIKPTATCA